MAYRILFISGGTGGHVYPIVPIIKSVQNLAQQSGKPTEIEIMGEGSLLLQTASDLSLPLRKVLNVKLPRYPSPLVLINIFKLPVVFFQSLYHIWNFMPDLVFVKGSGSSLVAGLAAKLLFVPLIIHESDAIPAITNRILGKFAVKILTSFEESKKYFRTDKVIITGHPIRLEILDARKADGLIAFGFNEQKPVVLIIGGSQGASSLNKILFDSLIQLVDEFQIIHQSGEAGYKTIGESIERLKKEGEQSYGKLIAENYKLKPFLNVSEMAQSYAASDVIVSRAGAGSIFEIAALGKPVVIIPLPNSGSDHQIANAQEIAKFGAILIEQENLTPHILIQEIKEAYQKREEISVKIKEFTRLNAADLIAKEMLS